MQRFSLTFVIAVVASIAVAASVPALVGHHEAAAQQEDAAQIRDLAERLLTYPYGMVDGQGSRAQLLVGRLPADFPFIFPIPPGGRLVGSAVRGSGGEAMSVEIAVEAPGTPAQALSFYDNALPAAGLSLAPSSYSGSGGFQAGSAKRSDTYCLGETGPWLNMSAAEQSEGQGNVRLSDIRVSVTLRFPTSMPYPAAGPCSSQQPVGYGSGSAGRLLPRLSGPSGVPMQTSGMSMGQDYAASSVTVTTVMSIVNLEAYFAQQLESAGWSRRTSGSEGPVAWSLWNLPEDGEWQGFLTAVEAPGENRRRLSLLVESTAAGNAVIGPTTFIYPR